MPATFSGKTVGSIGYGLLGLTWRNPPTTEEEAFACLKSAIAQGCTFWNGGQIYGPPGNNTLNLLNKYFAKYPEDASKVVLNIKGASRGLEPDGSATYVRESVESSVKDLGGVGFIDQFECARVDPNTPISETMTTLKALVGEGKIGAVALCEVSANTIREAVKYTSIAAVEIELSLWCTDPLDNGIVSTCGELGIPIIAYSPMGRGFLTGQIKSVDDLPEKDIRRLLPRFQPGNFERNMDLVRQVEILAKEKGCTSGQLAINWVRSLSDRPGYPPIIPIPGASSTKRVEENSRVVELTDEDMARIDAIINSFEVSGDRYHAAGQRMING